jgi:hypothetical protein
LDGKIIKREQVFIGTWNGGPAILAASFELVGYEIDASQWQPLSDELAVTFVLYLPSHFHTASAINGRPAYPDSLVDTYNTDDTLKAKSD